MPAERSSSFYEPLRQLLVSDATDPLRSLARSLGLRNGRIRTATAARRLRGARTGAEAALALQDEAQAMLQDGTLVMGTQSYFAPTVKRFRGDSNRVVIGAWCSVAADAVFYVGGMHPVEWVTTYGIREMFGLDGAFEPPMPRSHGDIVVGNDCWITEGTTILSGVNIGNGAVVATKAVVTKSVRPYAIVAGNPAREITRRFTDEQVEALERIAWWDWPVETVLERVRDLNGSTIEAFIDTYDRG